MRARVDWQPGLQHPNLNSGRPLWAARSTIPSMNIDYESLWSAVTEGDLWVVQQVLGSGADVDAESPVNSPYGSRTALQLAADRGHVAVVAKLLAAGAEIEKRTASAPPALQLAASRGHTKVVKLLLDAGAAVDSGGRGNTPLAWAAAAGQGAVVQELIDAGAAFDLSDNMNWTALHHAAALGYVNVVKALLAAGADPCITSVNGSTPLHLAAAHGHIATVKVILDHAAVPVPILVGAASNATAMIAPSGGRQPSFTQLDTLSTLLNHIAEIDYDTAVQFVKDIPNEAGFAAAFSHGWLSTMNAVSQQRATVAKERKELKEQQQGVQQLIIGLAAMQRKGQSTSITTCQTTATTSDCASTCARDKAN